MWLLQNVTVSKSYGLPVFACRIKEIDALVHIFERFNFLKSDCRHVDCCYTCMTLVVHHST